MSIIKRQFMANITYSGFTYNTLLHIEYKHTGTIYKLMKKDICEKHTTNKDIADEWISKNKKVKSCLGHYYMYRLAIPNTNAKGSEDIWYINNEGDSYQVNKISKYGRKIHAELTSNDIKPLNN